VYKQTNSKGVAAVDVTMAACWDKDEFDQSVQYPMGMHGDCTFRSNSLFYQQVPSLFVQQQKVLQHIDEDS
jgi:hypothetical protein